MLSALFCASLCAQADVQATSPFANVAAALTSAIQLEMKNQSLPAVSIALVDGQHVVWAQGFGLSDPQQKIPAAADTIYRVGSVSKLFTDIAIMQLVEKGRLDLDAPVNRYLPDFHPVNPFAKPITLRELMSHRSGLVREPPIGHYFDSTAPTLEATVKSLNHTTLVYPPGTHTKYSNAAIAVAGYVLEKQSGQPFTTYVRDAVLQPLGMSASAFTPTPEILAKLAHASIWTYDGRVFDAPTFQLGMAPAGCMYSSVLDLSKFVSMLFAAGRGSEGAVLKPETLQSMWQPQFPTAGEKQSFGIGFRLANLDGHALVGHGGAIYGFATELEALPADKLGVVAVTTMDSANATMTRIANYALRLILASKQGAPLPKFTETQPVSLPRARGRLALPARCRNTRPDRRNGRLSTLSSNGGNKLELRRHEEELITDDRLSYGTKLQLFHNAVKTDEGIFQRAADAEPKPAPHDWQSLIGEYGWDYDTLYILEKDGKLTSLIEWYEYEPLEQVSPYVYRYPRRGLYDGETIVFTRDAAGRATQVKVGGVVFPRRAVGPSDGRIFRIKPLMPIPQLRAEALQAQPPKETGTFKQPDLVELTSLDPSIKLDIRYATTDNFPGATLTLAPAAVSTGPSQVSTYERRPPTLNRQPVSKTGPCTMKRASMRFASTIA